MGPAPSQDGDLVERIRRGDRTARETLAGRARDTSFVFALQLTGDPHLAQDIAQDSVVRFLGSLDRFDTSRAIDPWLYQITRNRLRDVVRRERVRTTERLELDGGAERPEVVDSGADPLGAVIRTELQRTIWHEIGSLSEAHREIVVLRDHHGLAYRDIAAVLGIPEGTVMSRLHAARTALRARLIASGSWPHTAPEKGEGA